MWFRELLQSMGLEDDKINEAIAELDKEKSNLKTALEEERKKRKLTDEEAQELQRLKRLEDDSKEKEKIAKGEQKQIIDDLKTQLTEKETLLSELNVFKDKHLERLETERTSLLESIPEDKREFIQLAIDWKDHEVQVQLLGKFAEEYKTVTPQSDPSAPAWWTDPSDQSAYEQAKSKWDVKWMLENAPTI